MSQDKAKLIEIAREVILQVDWKFQYYMSLPSDIEGTVADFLPLLEALGISEEDLGFED